jgi:RHS repeat-associated protein
MSLYGWMYFFQGKRFDPTTGTYDSRRRVYSSLLGRPLQTDPLGLAPDINPYRWEGDKPTNAKDPLGTEAGGSGTSLDALPSWVAAAWGDHATLLFYVQDAGISAALGAAAVALIWQRIHDLEGPGTTSGPTPYTPARPIQPPIRMVKPIHPPLRLPICPPANPPLPVRIGLPPIRPITPENYDKFLIALGGLFVTIWDYIVYSAEAQAGWEADLARNACVAEEMRRRGFSVQEIANWRRIADERAEGRFRRALDGLPDTLGPFPAP